MKNKKKVKELLAKIRAKAEEGDDQELKDLCKEAADTVETEDDGSNPPGGPPTHKP